MRKNQKKTRPQEIVQLAPLSGKKSAVFTITAVFVPIILLCFFEALLRLTHYGGDDRLFVSIPTAQSPYYGINTEIGKRYFSQIDFSPTPRKDLFLKEKPANDYRIFVLGGSSAAGFPYGNNITFPRILQRRLQDAFPDKKIEVVNTAMTAINSYTLLDFMDEILQQKPDLLLIYAGHNEFYGALGVASVESLGQRWVTLTYLKLRELKFFILMRDGVRAIKKMIAKPEKQTVDDPFQTVMARIVKQPEIAYGSRRYEQGRRQFQANMEAIAKKATAAHIPVILSELVSNVRDQQPFISLPPKELLSAQVVFEQARALEEKGETDQARQLYLRAKDLDALRFRASEDFNAILHQIADKYKMPIIPMMKVFEQSSPDNIIGQLLMTEHLHPNIDGYFLMADAFLETLRQNKFISPNWPNLEKKPSEWYRSHWGYTALDSVFADMTIRHLKSGWPFKPASMPNRFFMDFHAKTKEEAIVVNILQIGKKTLEQGHLELADAFEKEQNYEQAFREYLALVYIVPYLDLFYQPMIEMLVRQKNYNRALVVLYDALKYQDTAFVYKWIGQIYLVIGKPQQGLAFIEEALKREPSDAQTVYNACRGYYNIGKLQQGDRWFQKFSSLVPNAPEIGELSRLRAAIQGANNKR
jgi:lysophospholipase L1-like esterase